MSLVSIAIIDDQPLMVEAIKLFLSRNREHQVIAVGTSANDFYNICCTRKPSVAIVELGMGDDVYLAIAAAAKAVPDCKIIAFTAATGVEFAIRALDAGAHAYVLKRGNPQELLYAIKSVTD